MNLQERLAIDHHRMRQEVLLQRVLDGLRQTVRLRSSRPGVQVEEVCADFTDESARFIAPLIEAVDILESIILASDGCIGHRQCARSMEPLQRARALLQGKWEADSGERRNWP